MVDKDLLRRRYRRSLARYDGEAVLQRELAGSLVAAVQGLGRTVFPRALEIGCGTGQLTKEIALRLTIGEFYANDINEECVLPLKQTLGPCVAPTFLGGDIETLALLPQDLDLVAANAVFHWLENPGVLLGRIARALVSGGILAFTTFGPENLKEIGELTGVRLAYPAFEQIRGTLAQDFHVRCATERQVVLRFDSPRRVLEHLRGSGANALSAKAWTRGGLLAFEREYRRRFPLPDGGVALSYHPLLFVAER